MIFEPPNIRQSIRVFVVALVLIASGIAIANASDNVAQTSNGYQYTPAEARQAIDGYHRVFTDDNFTLVTELTSDSDMPVYDRVAHYVGPQRFPNGQMGFVVWLNERYRGDLNNLKAADSQIATQIVAATLMVAMDGGLAGQKWKAMFADASRKDHTLSANIVDRYQNRHELVALLARDRSIYDPKYQPQGILGLTGNDLTTPIHYVPGLVGLAQGGVGAARITELLDDKGALAEVQSQQFIDDWFSHVTAMMPNDSTKAFLNQQRGLLIVECFIRSRKKRGRVRSSHTGVGSSAGLRTDQRVPYWLLRRTGLLQRAVNATDRY